MAARNRKTLPDAHEPLNFVATFARGYSGNGVPTHFFSTTPLPMKLGQNAQCPNDLLGSTAAYELISVR